MRTHVSPLIPHPSEAGPRPHPGELCSLPRAGVSLPLSFGGVEQHAAAARMLGTPGKCPGVLAGGKKARAVLQVHTKEGFVLPCKQEQGSGKARVGGESP